MPSNFVKILFIGDIVGKTGRDVISSLLSAVISTEKPDLVIANGENLAGGFGLNSATSEEMFKSGINVLTSGNHIYDNKDVKEIINDNRVVRPINYHPDLPGHGYAEMDARGINVTVINALGRVFMQPVDCPFRTVEKFVSEKGRGIYIVDFHAEATAEKQALAAYLDGKVSAVIGTHTHVQTADERILPKGTAFITDAGITGSQGGVIGFQSTGAIKRTLYQIPQRFEVDKSLPVFNGVSIKINTETFKAESIKRIYRNAED